MLLFFCTGLRFEELRLPSSLLTLFVNLRQDLDLGRWRICQAATVAE